MLWWSWKKAFFCTCTYMCKIPFTLLSGSKYYKNERTCFDTSAWNVEAERLFFKSKHPFKSNHLESNNTWNQKQNLGQILPSLLNLYIVIIDWFLHDRKKNQFSLKDRGDNKKTLFLSYWTSFYRRPGDDLNILRMILLAPYGHLEKISLKFCRRERQGRMLESRKVPSEVAAPKVHSDTSFWVGPKNLNFSTGIWLLMNEHPFVVKFLLHVCSFL